MNYEVMCIIQKDGEESEEIKDFGTFYDIPNVGEALISRKRECFTVMSKAHFFTEENGIHIIQIGLKRYK